MFINHDIECCFIRPNRRGSYWLSDPVFLHLSKTKKPTRLNGNKDITYSGGKNAQ